ncbi:hypothetical protein SBA6_640008 [Candidatus Sulfopaludibacter sp. SbA6]|nr:hypothetical protein SBA6_640008 [Candidatus Sulfopaludibacter sp. SbA6]
MDQGRKKQKILDTLDSQITVNDTGNNIMTLPPGAPEIHVVHRNVGTNGGTIDLQGLKPQSYGDATGTIKLDPKLSWRIWFGNDNDHGNWLRWNGITAELQLFGGSKNSGDDWKTTSEGALDNVDLITDSFEYYNKFNPAQRGFAIYLK